MDGKGRGRGQVRVALPSGSDYFWGLLQELCDVLSICFVSLPIDQDI